MQAAVVDGDDAVGHVFAKRQQGDGAAVAEAFVGGVFVGGGVGETGHEHGAAEVVHIGGNAGLAAGL